MHAQHMFLMATNALLVGLMAFPMWLAWQHSHALYLKWMAISYALAAGMYLAAPYAQNMPYEGANLVLALTGPFLGAALVAAITAMLIESGQRRNRLLAGAAAALAVAYAVSLLLKLPPWVRAGFLGVTFFWLGMLCLRHSFKEPGVGLALVGASLFAFPATLFALAFLPLPEHSQLAVVALPYLALGVSVLAVLALRSRRDQNATDARMAAMAEESRDLATQLSQQSAQAQAQSSGAARLIEGFNKTIAHDLKGAIAAVQAGVQFARELVQEGECSKANDLLSKVAVQAQQAIDRISALQRLAQTQSSPLAVQPVDLEQVAQSALTEVMRQQSGQAKLVPVYLMPMPKVMCDPGLMRVFFINLLSNAIKFSAPVPGATVHVGSLQDEPNDEPVFFIRDTGVGFDPSTAPELFTPFGRQAPDSRGSGVGVSVAQQIVQRHGGRLWVESDVGQGATFFFTLGPALDADKADLAAESH